MFVVLLQVNQFPNFEYIVERLHRCDFVIQQLWQQLKQGYANFMNACFGWIELDEFCLL